MLVVSEDSCRDSINCSNAETENDEDDELYTLVLSMKTEASYCESMIFIAKFWASTTHIFIKAYMFALKSYICFKCQKLRKS